MGKASSSKKIKRVQQAGASRTPGQRRQLGFPALIAAILVLGLLFTALAVMHRREVEEVAPTESDHWVEAFGTFVCDQFVGNFANLEKDAAIDLHDDGLIHVHPNSEETSGAGAQFGLFAASVGLTVGDGTMTLPDGTVYNNGDDCNGEEGRVALYVWPPQAGENTDPRIVTSNIAANRFLDDGSSFVLAFAPRDAEVTLPPSQAKLENPNNDEPAVQDAPAGAEGDATAEGDAATTTVPADSTVPTTAAGG